MKKRTHQGNFTLSIFVLIFIFFTNCKKDSNDTNVIVAETGTVTDIEGNVYKTVKIGSQWWMAENLKTTKYTDGNPIYGYSWYGNDITNKNIYGALYNWDAVESGKLAPQGWHIPSDDGEIECHLASKKDEAFFVIDLWIKTSNIEQIVRRIEKYSYDFFQELYDINVDINSFVLSYYIRIEGTENSRTFFLRSKRAELESLLKKAYNPQEFVKLIKNKLVDELFRSV